MSGPGASPPTIAACFRAAREQLAGAGIAEPDTDLRLLMAQVLNTAPGQIILHLRDSIGAENIAAFEALVARRAAREPLSHILGKREFYGRMFEISPAVLDPRPETETLVALALQEPFERLLDLGTGSGCIALTLLAERPRAKACAVDLSEQALDVARRNAAPLGVADRVDFARSDWWQAVDGRFDLIVSNPPYISAEDYEGLAPELAFEPKIALTPGDDGLDAYRQIAAGLSAHLTLGGRVLVEFGAGQGDAVAGIFRAKGLTQITLHKDLDARDRVLSARAPAE